MAIYRLLVKETFSPEEITRMTAAYEAALTLLKLADRNAPVTEILAKKIVEVTRAGEHAPPRICARAIKELGIDLPE